MMTSEQLMAAAKSLHESADTCDACAKDARKDLRLDSEMMMSLLGILFEAGARALEAAAKAEDR